MREPVYGTMEVKETRELAKVSFEYIDRDIADIERSFGKAWVSFGRM